MPVSVETVQESSLEHRVAVLKKLKQSLEAQRDKFRDYLELLEEEEAIIRSGKTEKLTHFVQSEQQIIREIETFQKTIEPMEDLYRQAYPSKREDVSALQTSLDRLKKEALENNKRNRNLLRERMADMKEEIEKLRIRANKKSPYGNVHEPTLIDIMT